MAGEGRGVCVSVMRVGKPEVSCTGITYEPPLSGGGGTASALLRLGPEKFPEEETDVFFYLI